jgi:hypothetical protein
MGTLRDISEGERRVPGGGVERDMKTPVGVRMRSCNRAHWWNVHWGCSQAGVHTTNDVLSLHERPSWVHVRSTPQKLY